MIHFITGNLLESKANCLVNTVNCEGYMGKGIAYQFKLKYPENNKDYVKACKSGKLHIGSLHYYTENKKLIINFPTKDKWRRKSEIEYIEVGLDELVKLLPNLNIKSIAIPPLGCGNGGLEWNTVKDLIINKLSLLSEKYDIYIYEPSSGYSAISKEVPKLSTSGLVLMDIKLGLNKFNSLRLQKTAYFMNIFLGENYFRFVKYKYGPYDNSISIISRNIREFQNYYNTKNTKEAYNIAHNILVSRQVNDKLECLKPSIERALSYVNKINDDSFLECISTVLFLIENNSFQSEDEIIAEFKLWSEDKANRFNDEDIRNALLYLINTKIVVKTLVDFKIDIT